MNIKDNNNNRKNAIVSALLSITHYILQHALHNKSINTHARIYYSRRGVVAAAAADADAVFCGQ